MTTLRDLLLDSRDGEWGQGEASADSREMSVIRGTDFEAVRVGDAAKVPVRHLATRHADRKTMRAWDILIETAGGSKDRPTGRTLLLTPSRLATFDRPVTCASFARFLRIDPSKAYPQFVFWLLQDLYEQQTILQFHTQHTGVARFQFTTFADNWPLQLPDLSNQQRIAGILSAYDDLIENNTRRIAIFEDMARRLYEEWFVHFRFPGGNGEMPDDWSKRTVGDIFTLQRGFDLPSAERTAGIYPVIAASGVHSYHDQFRVKGPGVVTGRSGTIGKVMFVESDFWPLNTALWVKDFKIGGAIFAFYVLSNLELHTSNSGSAVPSLNRNIVHLLPHVMPSQNVVKAFEEHVAPMRQQISKLTDSNTVLRTARDFLLPKLISGEIGAVRAEASDFLNLAIAAE